MPQQDPSHKISNRFPGSIEMRDIVSIVAVAISITLAYGVFSSRISVLEKDALHAQARSGKHEAEIERLQLLMQRAQSQFQENESQHDNIYRELKKPAPPKYRPVE